MEGGFVHLSLNEVDMAGKRLFIASGRCSHKRVLPSMSVKRKVMVPIGRSIVIFILERA
jgi:hypothetical protein